jgi:hypothetical protein
LPSPVSSLTTELVTAVLVLSSQRKLAAVDHQLFMWKLSAVRRLLEQAPKATKRKIKVTFILG